MTSKKIYIEACMSPESVYDAGLLWCAWAAEQGREPHVEMWLQTISNRVSTGWWETPTEPTMAVPNSWLLIARDANRDDQPVGMVECFFAVDPYEGGMCEFADHAYVLPEYREAGVFSKLAHAALSLGELPGVRSQILPMEPDSVLSHFYEEFAGGEFEKYAISWRRKLTNESA